LPQVDSTISTLAPILLAMSLAISMHAPLHLPVLMSLMKYGAWPTIAAMRSTPLFLTWSSVEALEGPGDWPGACAYAVAAPPVAANAAPMSAVALTIFLRFMCISSRGGRVQRGGRAQRLG
jgi:hypothetical protein